jgi:hypothetical protein
MTIKYIFKKYVFLFTIIIFSIPTIVYALNTRDTWYDWSPNSYTTASVTSDLLCKKIGNTHPTATFFLPTKTLVEYNNITNSPYLFTYACWTNLASWKYSHSNSYNYPSANLWNCPDSSWYYWDGLTDWIINTSKSNECNDNYANAIWSSAYANNTYNMMVSIDLWTSHYVDTIRVYNEFWPYGGDWYPLTSIRNNTKTVQVYARNTTVASDCYVSWWTTTWWTYIWVHTFSSHVATYNDFPVTPTPYRCIMLRFPINTTYSWWCNANWCFPNYMFIRELQVFGL